MTKNILITSIYLIDVKEKITEHIFRQRLEQRQLNMAKFVFKTIKWPIFFVLYNYIANAIFEGDRIYWQQSKDF